MKWFYAQDGQSLGPVDERELAHLAATGRIGGSTLVWHDALPDWRPYAVAGPIPTSAATDPPIAKPAFPYAGFWVRLAAAIFDILIVLMASIVALPFIIFVIWGYFVFFPGIGSKVIFRVLFQWVPLCVPILIYGFYETVCIGDGGATPGKRILGVRVVQADGGPVSYSRAFGRVFAKILNPLTLGLGCFLIAFDAEKCGVHDHLCLTRVIYSRLGAD